MANLPYRYDFIRLAAVPERCDFVQPLGQLYPLYPIMVCNAAFPLDTVVGKDVADVYRERLTFFARQVHYKVNSLLPKLRQLHLIPIIPLTLRNNALWIFS